MGLQNCLDVVKTSEFWGSLLNHLFNQKAAWISDAGIAWVSIGIIGVWSILS